MSARYSRISVVSTFVAVFLWMIAETGFRNDPGGNPTFLPWLMVLTDQIPQTPQPLGWKPLSPWFINESRILRLICQLALVAALLCIGCALRARRAGEMSSAFAGAAAVALIVVLLSIRWLVLMG